MAIKEPGVKTTRDIQRTECDCKCSEYWEDNQWGSYLIAVESEAATNWSYPGAS